MSDDQSSAGGNFESRSDALQGDSQKARDGKTIAMWLEAIDLSSKEEADWRKRAKEVADIFKDAKERNDRRYNILYSNIETIVPAVYSSLPTPDVRRRYNDKDPAGRLVSQLLERALTYSIDTYDFDSVLRGAAINVELVGRTVDRVRYVPYFAPGEPASDGEEATGETVTYEEVTCEPVNWSNFRRGPGRTWDDVPWIAFELFLTREQLNTLSPSLGPKVKLDCPVDGYDESKSDGPPPEIFMRARVWEIWDKEKKQVVFVATGYKEAPIKTADDPLGLHGFYPIPRPIYAVTTPDSLIPIEPYRYYKDQAEELDRLTRRITKLIQVLKWRGFYPGSAEGAGAMTQLADADDGEMIPVSDFQSFAGAAGDLSKAFWMMPIEECSVVLKNLYEQREQVKQVIYEITGVADILRGSTNPNETATAQNIKSQWGSLRIQRKQAEIQRYARDLFRLKAEIMAEKFSIENLEMMTGIKLLPQAQKDAMQKQIQAQQAQMGQQPGQPAPSIPEELQEQLDQPSREEVAQLLHNDILRTYRVDVESDSTVRGDLTKYQQTMTEFLQGTAAFLQAIGPMVQEGIMPKSLAVQLFIPYARQFRLGKATEDALEEFTGLAEKADKQPKPPSPEQMKMQADRQKANLDMQIATKKAEIGQQSAQADLLVKQQTAAMDLKMEQAELAMKEKELELKAQELGMKAMASQQQMDLDRSRMEMEGQAAQHQHELGMEEADAKHAMGLEMMAAKAKQPRANA